MGGRQICNAWCWHDTHVEYVDPFGCEARRDGAVEHRTTAARIAGDEPTRCVDDARCGAAQTQGQFGGQLGVRGPTQAIGAEPHLDWLSASSTGEPYGPS